MIGRLFKRSVASLAVMALGWAAAGANEDVDVTRGTRRAKVQSTATLLAGARVSKDPVFTIDRKNYTRLVPPTPRRDPFGRPLHSVRRPSLGTNAASGGVSISSLDAYGISGTLNGWNHTHPRESACTEDTSFLHQINTPQTWDYYTEHFFRTSRTDWIGTPWIYHSSPDSNQYVWESVFQRGEVVYTYGYTWKNGVTTGAWGPNVTVATASDEDWHPVSNEVLDFISGKIVDMLKRDASVGNLFDDLMKWGFSLSEWQAVTAEFGIQVLDENGNPLQSTLNLDWPNYVKTFNGNAIFSSKNNGNNAIGDGYTLYVTQPNGSGSFDGALNGRTATLNFSRYNYAVSNHAWGTAVNRMPIITVVFKSDGTTRVLEPQPYSWDLIYDADELPPSPWTNRSHLSVSDGALKIGMGDWTQNKSLNFLNGTLEVRAREASTCCVMRTFITNNNSTVADLYIGNNTLTMQTATEDVLRYSLDTSVFHTYRITLTDSHVNVYADGVLALSSSSPETWGGPHQIILQQSPSDEVYGYWDYVVYSGQGAFDLP